MAAPAYTVETGVHDLGSVTISRIEPIGTNAKVVWLHLHGYTTAIKTMASTIGKVGIHDAASGHAVVETKLDDYQGRNTKVAWLKSWNGVAADQPQASSPRGNSTGGYASKETARIAALGLICTHAPLAEVKSRIELFNAATGGKS